MFTNHFKPLTANNSNFSTDCDIEKFNILRLIRSENVGPATFFNLLKIFGTATNIIDAINQGKSNNIANIQLLKGLEKDLLLQSVKILLAEVLVM